ncbi:hypothetical protein C0993_012104 [Termitomyces sp. T159_Od127]|nr:hypothetical protein C0993_012104 [Termitomyces sp. T159_Od127]
MVDSTADGKILEKNITGASNPTQTLPLINPRPRDNLRSPSHIPQLSQPHSAVFRPQHHPEVPQFYELCDAEREAAVYDGDKHWVVRRVCGISDAFGSALWGLDYAFQMASNNFGGAITHVGGQNVFYNVRLPFVVSIIADQHSWWNQQPFTPPPTNQSTFHQWTVGPMYYTALVAAESLGPSNGTQVLDLGANDFTPCYGFYENGAPVCVGCINYVTDPTGASDLKVQIAIGGSGIGQPNQSPATVKVKYLLASSVSQKGNFTWAGQTFGDNFASDGRPVGDINITTITCNGTMNLCTVPVSAPSYALIYLTYTSLNKPGSAATQTFATTVHTRFRNTATVD